MFFHCFLLTSWYTHSQSHISPFMLPMLSPDCYRTNKEQPSITTVMRSFGPQLQVGIFSDPIHEVGCDWPWSAWNLPCRALVQLGSLGPQAWKLSGQSQKSHVPFTVPTRAALWALTRSHLLMREMYNISIFLLLFLNFNPVGFTTKNISQLYSSGTWSILCFHNLPQSTITIISYPDSKMTPLLAGLFAFILLPIICDLFYLSRKTKHLFRV